MRKKIVNKSQIYAARFLRLTLLIAAIIAVYHLRWTLFFVTCLILFLTFIPRIIQKRYRINIPIEYEFGIIVFIYASLFLGDLYGYYTKIWWYDLFLHGVSGLALGFCGFLIMYFLYYNKEVKASPLLVVVFAFCFALAIGALWEIFEFGMDYFFKTNMQKSGLVDTMWDLIVDALGAFVTSLIGYYYIKGKKTSLFARAVDHFVKNNPRIFKE